MFRNMITSISLLHSSFRSCPYAKPVSVPSVTVASWDFYRNCVKDTPGYISNVTEENENPPRTSEYAARFFPIRAVKHTFVNIGSGKRLQLFIRVFFE